MKTLKSCRLYAILDTGYVAPERLVETARAVLKGGADILQLRAKELTDEQILGLAPAIRDLCSARGIPFILNDRPRLAGQLDTAGVHVGQDDFPVEEARRLMRARKIVGKSTHSTAQIEAALAEKPDYIGVGPVYATPTKPDYPPVGLDLVRHAAQNVKIPFFCIGGIKLENVDEVLAAGASRIVVVSGILLAPDPEAYTRELKKKLSARKN